MRVQSIRAAIQVRHIAGNRLFCLAVKMALRKMHAIAECHYLAQKIRAMAEALQYSRHLLPSRVRAPFVIDLREIAGGVGVFNEADLVFDSLFRHWRIFPPLLRCRFSNGQGGSVKSLGPNWIDTGDGSSFCSLWQMERLLFRNCLVRL